MLSGVNEFINCLFALASSRVVSMANDTVSKATVLPRKRSLALGSLCCRVGADGIEAAVTQLHCGSFAGPFEDGVRCHRCEVGVRVLNSRFGPGPPARDTIPSSFVARLSIAKPMLTHTGEAAGVSQLSCFAVLLSSM